MIKKYPIRLSEMQAVLFYATNPQAHLIMKPSCDINLQYMLNLQQNTKNYVPCGSICCSTKASIAPIADLRT